MTTTAMTCPECGEGDDINMDDFGGAFCMRCEHEWATTDEAKQRAKAVAFLHSFAEYGVDVHSPVNEWIKVMRRLDSDGDFDAFWTWSEVWSVFAYWIHCDEEDHGPIGAA